MMKRIIRILAILVITYPLIGILVKSFTCLSYLGDFHQCISDISIWSYLLFWPVIMVMFVVSYPFFLGFLALVIVFLLTILMHIALKHENKESKRNSSDLQSQSTETFPASNIISTSRIFILTYVFGIISTFLSGYLVYSNLFGRFDIQHVPFNNDFEYKNSLSCVVKYSTSQDIGELSFREFNEKNFTIRGLDSDTPEIQQNEFVSKLKKIQEGDSVIVLQRVPLDSQDTSVDIIEILKDRGTYTRSSMGFGQYFGGRENLYPDGFHYVIAQKGTCE